ncbi:MAG: ABC transporter permease subunit, partial [Chloroflexota bacterium]
GIAMAILTRPIRRSDVVLGKWLGLVALIAVYAAIATGLEFVISGWLLNYVPPDPVLVIFFLVAEAVVVLTLALAFSTRVPGMTGGIVSLVVFGIAWMAGIAGAVGAALHSHTIQNVGTIMSLVLPTDGLWRAAIYHLEPVAVIATESGSREASANPFFVAQPPTAAYLAWAGLWILAALVVGVWSFNRRDL